MEKKNLIEDLLLFAAIMVVLFVMMLPILIASHTYPIDREQQKKSENATAGITMEMSSMQKEAFKTAEPDMEKVENYIESVSAQQEKIVESKNDKDVEAEVTIQTREECLINYFGYVPEEWELQEFEQIVMDESGNTEPEDGIGAVADVVANRCRSSKFPNTIHEVIYQRGQFQPVGDGTFGRFPVTDLVSEICADHISNGASYPSILYFTAGRYNTSGTPAFQIGHHYFSY